MMHDLKYNLNSNVQKGINNGTAFLPRVNVQIYQILL